MHRDISVIIPTCHFELLKRCITAVLRNTNFDKTNVEFIVVMNGCEPEAKQFIESLGDNFRYIWIDSRVGVCTSTNLGAKIAHGDYIVKLDDDAEILDFGGDSLWLEMLKAPFEQKENVGQTGPTVQIFKTEVKDYKCIIGFISMIPKKIWDEVGGYDTDFDPGIGEDTDISIRIQKAGYSLELCCEKFETIDNHFYGNYPVYHISIADYKVSYLELVKRNHEKLLLKHGNM